MSGEIGELFMRGFKNALAVAATSLMVTVSGLTVAAGPAQALSWRSFTWPALFAGDCTMSPGATWTLYSDGTAKFDGVVSSTDSDDAWLMWANILDTNHSSLGRITNAVVDNPDRTEFVRGLGNGAQRWLANGTFPADWFPLIGSMSLSKHC
jgi:hypothetical protein